MTFFITVRREQKSGRRLLQTLLMIAKQSIQELWSPCHIGNQGNKILQELLQTGGWFTSNSATISENAGNIGHRNPQITWKLRSKVPTTSEPSKNVGHRRPEGNPKERSGVLNIFQEDTVLEIHLVKISNPTYGHIPTVMETAVHYENRSRLNNQP